ncbi:hypothetical protein HDU67_009855 [Dinochytrium kinnereticum]|nr:hypothetical protein HDU67_009855 [Dinochytrium kinnereticum]
MKVVAVGSTNRAKLASVEQALQKVFPSESPHGLQVIGTNVASGVRDQPLSDDETMTGAINRARSALEMTPNADLGVGIEGGIHKIGERWFESGWVAVIDSTGKMGLGTSARYEISAKIMERIHAGQELADIMDDMTGTKEVRHNAGAMGVFEIYAFTFFFGFILIAWFLRSFDEWHLES